VVGLVFGAFHLSSYRFLSTSLLGLVLSGIVVGGGSIYPAMVLHACHNALLIWAQVSDIEALTSRYPQYLVGLALVSVLGIAFILRGLKAGKN
jgi:membrane protease YdiL (CAAX protease family)